MHVPDGFLDAPTSLATAAVAAAAVAFALRGARRELDDRAAPLAGLVATFVFAAQMVNFPVGAGTSGHLIGAALAAVLVGPWTATLCLTVVLLVQGLLFADGGLTALGTNVTLMGVVAVWIGYAVFRLALLALPRRVGSVPLAAGLGGFVSVPAAALSFAGLFAVGGTAPIDAGTWLPRWQASIRSSGSARECSRRWSSAALSPSAPTWSTGLVAFGLPLLAEFGVAGREPRRP
jgi:cobalt/nickel transport system permease protein